MSIETRVRLTDAVKEPHLRGAVGRIMWEESDFPHSVIVDIGEKFYCQLGHWEFELVDNDTPIGRP